MNKLYDEDSIKNIADAIREKNGSTDTYKVGEMAAAVQSIEGGGTDLSLGLTSATVGQVPQISAVDDNGVPTAWEAADMVSGGGEGVTEKEWNDWATITVPEDGLNAFDISSLESGENLADKNVKEVFIFSPAIANSGAESGVGVVTINNIFSFHLNSFTRNNRGMLKLWLSVENGYLHVRYAKRDTDWHLSFPGLTYAFNEQDGDFSLNSLTSGELVACSIGIGQPPIAVRKIDTVKIQCATGINSGVTFEVKIRSF